MKEKTKIIVHRLIWLSVLLLIIIIPIIINISKPKLEILSDEVYIDYYYSSLNETSVKINITFNRDVNSGYAVFNFYDASNNFLESKEIYLVSNGNTVNNLYNTISGKVDKYELISYEFSTVNTEFDLLWAFMFPAIIMFVATLFLNYKEYNFENVKISVYAGFYHHTLRINGEKFDEHSTLIYYTPIKLSTTINENTNIEAIITLTNRITLKINNKLISQQKKDE